MIGAVEPQTRRDSQSPLLWTSKSLLKLSQSLYEMGHKIGRMLVGEFLHKLGYRIRLFPDESSAGCPASPGHL
jgi:hypothetical protein